jgi:hypothetical protein
MHGWMDGRMRRWMDECMVGRKVVRRNKAELSSNLFYLKRSYIVYFKIVDDIASLKIRVEWKRKVGVWGGQKWLKQNSKE